jgi:GTP-binding protein HflX
MLATLRHNLPETVFVSAETGEGVDELRAAVEARLPQPGVLIEALVPWARGDLVDKAHHAGEVLEEEATADGTRLVARVHEGLAAELAAYAVDA